MNEKQAKKLGKKIGYSMSSWVSVPENGDYINTSLDWIGLGKTVNDENRWEYMELLCQQQCDSVYGEYLDEEDFDSIDSNEENWEAYRDGLQLGISKAIEEAQENWG